MASDPHEKPEAKRLQMARRIRRQAGLARLEAFARIYLPHHFSAPASTMHKEIFLLLEKAQTERDALIAIAAPRGNAKTTVVSLAYVLWALAHGADKFLVLLSATTDQARGLLSDIKRELEENGRIRSDFPELAEPPGRRPSPARWTASEIVTRTGIMVTALGSNQKIRGRKNKEARPTTIILDDIEGEDEAFSAERRARNWQWFQRAVMQSGARGTNVIAVGTLVHYDALLARLVGIGSTPSAPGWTTRRYQAILTWHNCEGRWEHFENLFTEKEEDEEFGTGVQAARAYLDEHRAEMLEGTEVLWPELEDYAQLMEVRIMRGRASFDAEKQNIPIDLENCLFNPETFHYWEDEFGSEEELLASIGDDLEMGGAWDPSLGKTKDRGDYSAVVTIARHKESDRHFVLDAVLERTRPSNMIELIVSLAKTRNYDTFYVESNQFQELLAEQLEEAAQESGVRIPIKEAQNTKNKVARIQSLETLISSGRLVFSRKHRLLIQQLREFPRGAHDDGPDALEMGIRAANSYVPLAIYFPEDSWDNMGCTWHRIL